MRMKCVVFTINFVEKPNVLMPVIRCYNDLKLATGLGLRDVSILSCRARDFWRARCAGQREGLQRSQMIKFLGVFDRSECQRAVKSMGLI